MLFRNIAMRWEINKKCTYISTCRKLIRTHSQHTHTHILHFAIASETISFICSPPPSSSSHQSVCLSVALVHFRIFSLVKLYCQVDHKMTLYCVRALCMLLLMAQHTLGSWHLICSLSQEEDCSFGAYCVLHLAACYSCSAVRCCSHRKTQNAEYCFSFEKLWCVRVAGFASTTSAHFVV